VAGGQGTFGLNFYLTDAQQERAIAYLRQQSVPIVLGSYADYDGEFGSDYPLVAAYVASRYRDAGVIPVEGAPRFRVLVENGRPPVRMDPYFGLPCFQ
jgi:hypothetical protein